MDKYVVEGVRPYHIERDGRVYDGIVYYLSTGLPASQGVGNRFVQVSVRSDAGMALCELGDSVYPIYNSRGRCIAVIPCSAIDL